jgi:excisionase family DNA binding protein
MAASPRIRNTSTAALDPQAVLKVQEVAAVLRCGINQAYDLVQSGEIRSVRIGRSVRVPRSALEDFLAGIRAR